MPRTALPPGGESGAPTGVLAPYGARYGPMIATSTSSVTSARPILVRQSRSDRRSSEEALTPVATGASAVARAWPAGFTARSSAAA